MTLGTTTTWWTVIETKWVYINKVDEHGTITRNKARLVVQRYNQEAIRLLVTFLAFKEFILYQIDVKSEFLNGYLKEDVYVKKPPIFESAEFPDHVYKLDKAL